MNPRGLALLPLVALAACSQLLGDLKVAGDGRDASALPDADVADLVATGDGPIGGCDPAAVPVAGALFASVRTGAQGASGAADAPLKTIVDALAAARAAGGHDVYLDEGRYPEQLDLGDHPGGVTLHGGWVRDTGDAWHPDCAAGARDRTVIASTGIYGVRLTSVTSGFALARLTITTADRRDTAADSAGKSRIALHVRGAGSKVALAGVVLVAASADHGGAATAGGPGAEPLCDGLMGCDDGAPGGEGTTGADATVAGTFTSNGFGPADGQPGAAPGSDGHDGAPGDPAESVMCVEACTCKDNCGAVDMPVDVPAGRCGSGGKGGEPGHAGRGGGASVALLATDARTTVTVVAGALTAGDGGNGSPGGAGGDGSMPTMGAEAPAVLCHAGGCKNDSPFMQCTICGFADPIGVMVGPHLAGGPGGLGGTGGAGGGGAGGPSYGVVTVGKATVDTDGATAITPGQGGKGGGKAKAGESGARVAL